MKNRNLSRRRTLPENEPSEAKLLPKRNKRKASKSTYHKTIKRRRIEDDDSQEISDQDLEEEEEFYIESKDNKSKKKKSSSKQSKAKKKAKAKNYITVTSKDILKGHFKFINNRKTPLNKQVSKEYREVTDQLIRNQ